MHRIDGSGNVDGAFSEGNPATGQVATQVTADWLNAVQEEAAGVIEGAGLALDKADNAQLLAAVRALAGQSPIRGLAYRRTAADALAVEAGEVLINGVLHALAADAALTLAGLPADSWVYLMAQAPTTGLTLAAGQLSATAAAPARDPAKGGGWYDGTGAQRCWGVLRTDGAGAILPCACDGRDFMPADGLSILSTETPATENALVSAGGPAAFNNHLWVDLHGEVTLDAAPLAALWVGPGDAGLPRGLANQNAAGNGGVGRGRFYTDASGRVTYKATAGALVNLHLLGFRLPPGIAR